VLAYDPEVNVEGRHYGGAGIEVLTRRQREVIKLIARGETNGRIAETLGISLDGAKWHVREIMRKLECETREDAVARWREQDRAGAAWKRVAGIPVVLRWILGGAVAMAVAGTIVVAAFLTQLDREAGSGDASSMSTPATVAARKQLDLVALQPASVRGVWLSLGNHPFRDTQPRPLDMDVAADAVIGARLTEWIAHMTPATIPVDGTVTGPPLESLVVLLRDGTRVTLRDAWTCSRSAAATSCVSAGPFVDVSVDDGPEVRMGAPELASWLSSDWRSELELISNDDALAARAGLERTVGTARP